MALIEDSFTITVFMVEGDKVFIFRMFSIKKHIQWLEIELFSKVNTAVIYICGLHLDGGKYHANNPEV